MKSTEPTSDSKAGDSTSTKDSKATTGGGFGKFVVNSTEKQEGKDSVTTTSAPGVTSSSSLSTATSQPASVEYRFPNPPSFLCSYYSARTAP